jgi:apolipoprotein N-acyltransferase
MTITAIAGALCVFAFAPFGWWPLQILGLATLFYQVLRSDSVKSAALIGWAFGSAGPPPACTGSTFPCIPTAACRAMAALAVLLLAPAWACMWRWPWAAPPGCASADLPLAAANLLVLPACWTLSEWLRGWLFTGFPWLSSGYAHNHSPLAGFAPVIGMYGLGWLAATLAGAAAAAPPHALDRCRTAVAAGRRRRAELVQWTTPQGQPIRCACCKAMCRRMKIQRRPCGRRHHPVPATPSWRPRPT